MTETQETQKNEPTFPNEAYILARFTQDREGFSIECNKVSPVLICEVVNQLLSSYVFPFVAKNDETTKQIIAQRAEKEVSNEATNNH